MPQDNLVGFEDGMDLRLFSDHRYTPLRGLQAKFREVRETPLLKKMVGLSDR